MSLEHPDPKAHNPNPKTKILKPKTLNQSQATMPLGKPNFHHLSMVTPMRQIPNPKPKSKTQTIPNHTKPKHEF